MDCLSSRSVSSKVLGTFIVLRGRLLLDCSTAPYGALRRGCDTYVHINVTTDPLAHCQTST